MASALNQFNLVSHVYDRMANLFFGTTLHDAQCHFISVVPERSNVLIVGGGTGEFLRALLQQKQNVTITYVDASSEMISLARLQVKDDRRVVFIHGTQDSVPSDLKADVIITPFFLDLFRDHSLNKVIGKLHSVANGNAIWIATDFTETGRISHRLLLWVMYRFFRITSHIEARRLPAWESHLSNVGIPVEEKSYRNGLIKTVLFKVSE